MDAPLTWQGYGRHQRPPPKSLDIAVAHFDLAQEIERLKAEEAWRDTGHNGMTLTKHGDLCVVLTVLKPRHRIPPHRIHGASTLQVVAGSALVHGGRRTVELLPGQLMLLAHDVPQAIEATGECALLLTFVPSRRH